MEVNEHFIRDISVDVESVKGILDELTPINLPERDKHVY